MQIYEHPNLKIQCNWKHEEKFWAYFSTNLEKFEETINKDSKLIQVTSSTKNSITLQVNNRLKSLKFVKEECQFSNVHPVDREESKKSFWKPLPPPIDCVSLSSSGFKGLSGARNGILRLWSTNDGHVLKDLRGHLGDVNDCVILPSDEAALSCGSDSSIRIWRLEDSLCVYTFKGAHVGGVLTLSIVERGRNFISGGRDGCLKLWDCASQSCITTLYQKPSSIQLSHGSSTSVSNGNSIKQDSILDSTPVNCSFVGIIPSKMGSIEPSLSSLSLSSSSSLLDERDYGTLGKMVGFVEESGTLRVIDCASRKTILKWKWKNPLTSCLFCPANSQNDSDVIFVGSSNGEMIAVDLLKSDGEPIAVFRRQCDESPILAMDYCQIDVENEGKEKKNVGLGGILTARGDGSLLLWNMRNGEILADFTGSDMDPIYDVAFHKSSQRLYTVCRDGIIRKYNFNEAFPV